MRLKKMFRDQEGAGSQWKNGLAWVLIGGLTGSMFLTLLIVPIMYYLVDSLKERLGRKKKQQRLLLQDNAVIKEK